MALGEKTGGKDFKKGHKKPGPGRPALTEAEKQARRLTRERFALIASKYLDTDIEELKLKMKDKKTPSLDMIVISVIIKAIQSGDYLRLNFLLDRLVGKVTEKIDHTSSDKSLTVSFVKPRE